ncbi:hypothetical protein GCK72_016521 [Caenorhabditis remanei]|uniref:Sdz-33 F-box domain-containing protein n=1 Tax=Caenorhabditis remanei TaxID=31234 RepID=A0A6A5G4X7_CAERE|nr:hypothetical protein GCK72_016521 [Caenorhabditis remanei]KAF1749976.1 hypothetical protein GCK72_016521 [Caenorhabditis remanei]
MMNPFEILNLSMANSRIKNVVQLYSKHARYFYRIEFSERPSIDFTGTEDIWRYEITADRNRTEVEDYYQNSMRIMTICVFGKDILEEVKSWFKYIKEIFNIDGGLMVIINLDTFPGQNKAITDWVNSQTTWTRHCDIDGEKVRDDDVKYVLNTLNIRITLNIFANVSDNFRFEIPQFLSQLYIENGGWIKLNQLLEIDASEIFIRNTKLTRDELTVFFKNWMCMKSQIGLECFTAGIEKRDDVDTILDVPHENFGTETIRTFELKTQEIKLRGGSEIRRCDGTTAAIFVTTEPDRLVLAMIVVKKMF